MHFTARLSWIAKPLLSSLSLTLLLSACEPPTTPPVEQEAPRSRASAIINNPLTIEDQQQLEQFRKAGGALPKALMECSGKLQASMLVFLKRVNADNLQALRERWDSCHEIYLATTTLQGFSPQQQNQLQQLHMQLGNTLTMPGFIDSIEGYPFSGIVNDASLELSEAALREQHGLTDEAEVSIGFGVVQFLLWGERATNTYLPPRPFNDFEEISQWQDSSENLPISEHPNNRRRSLLQLTVDILNQDCMALLNTWDTGNLPASHELANAWKIKQLQELISSLERWPKNIILEQSVLDWLQTGAIPAPIPTFDPSSTLRAQLENGLNQLIKAQG